MAKWQQIRIPVNYEVSTDGRVRRANTRRVSKPIEDRDGYLHSRFEVKKTKFSFPIHRLVAIAYIPNPENKPQVNHKNGNKKDNRVENLEWVTLQENRAHAIATGLTAHIMGEGAPNVKHTEKEVKKVFKLYHEKGLKRKVIAEKLNMTISVVNDILQGRTWKHLKLTEKYGTKKKDRSRK